MGSHSVSRHPRIQCARRWPFHDDSSPVTLTRTAPGDNAAPVPASLASPDAPSSSVPSPLRVVESLKDVPPLDNFHPAHQTTTESLRIPATSPDPTTDDAFVAPGIIIPHPTTSELRHPPSSFLHLLIHCRCSTAQISSLVNVTTLLQEPPRPTSAPDLSVATEDDGGPKPDHLLQSSSLPLVSHSDVAIVGPSLREPNTERTGDHIRILHIA
ncbi:hypothetical protein EDB84DRAFT_1474554, partial [Lactarius hengduanensis]